VDNSPSRRGSLAKCMAKGQGVSPPWRGIYGRVGGSLQKKRPKNPSEPDRRHTPHGEKKVVSGSWCVA